MRSIARPPLIGLVLLAPLAAALRARGQEADPLEQVFRGIHSGRISVVDLTHTLDDQSPFWPEGTAQSPFHAATAATLDRDGYFARTLAMPEHFGTHMDAPAHFDAQGLTVDRLPIESSLVAAVVLDVAEQVRQNPDYRVTAEDLQRWVKAHGAIPPRSAILIRTGWAARWPSQKDTMNQDAQGVLHFPGLSLEAARTLLDRAHPVAIGIDTPSIDYGPSKDFEVHHVTLSAGLYHLENLAHLDQLPATGAYLIALPLKLRAGSGGPTRVLALFANSPAGRSVP